MQKEYKFIKHVWKDKNCIFCGKKFILNSGKQVYCEKCGPVRRKLIKSINDIHSKMMDRCFNTKARDYRWYGEKGISVCKEWLDIKIFSKWMLNYGYKIGLTVDRLNSNKNYNPENCRLLTIQENLKNRSNIRFFPEIGIARCKMCREIKPLND
jgi:hypothetical protein